MQFGLHHMHVRRRAGFPKKAIDYIIYPVAIAAPFALVPQIIQIYSSHSVAGLSPITWGFLTVFNSLWVLYGFVHKELPIILTNGAFALFNLIIFVGALLFQ